MIYNPVSETTSSALFALNTEQKQAFGVRAQPARSLRGRPQAGPSSPRGQALVWLPERSSLSRHGGNSALRPAPDHELDE